MNKFAILFLFFAHSAFAEGNLINEIISTYKANEARFHANHRNHILTGAGKVEKIVSDFMGTGSYFTVVLDIDGSIIQCNTKNKNMAAKLDKGQIVKFKGVIYDVTLSTLILENCQFSDYAPTESIRSDGNKNLSAPPKKGKYDGYIYFAAEKPPTGKDAPSESPLCYKFKVASVEEQLSKLKKKYGYNLDAKIEDEIGESKVLTAKVSNDSGKPVYYKYFTNPTDCDSYQTFGEDGKLASKDKTGNITCDDFIKEGKHSDSFFSDVQYLGKLSGMHYVSKYDAGIINFLCNNDTEGLYYLYDYGDVELSTIDSFKEILGLKHIQINRQRSKEGISYESAYYKLIELGLCSACASGPAQQYAKNPDSTCAKLVEKALNGDKKAFKNLDSDSSPCD